MLKIYKFVRFKHELVAPQIKALEKRITVHGRFCILYKAYGSAQLRTVTLAHANASNTAELNIYIYMCVCVFVSQNCKTRKMTLE